MLYYIKDGDITLLKKFTNIIPVGIVPTGIIFVKVTILIHILYFWYKSIEEISRKEV